MDCYKINHLQTTALENTTVWVNIFINNNKNTKLYFNRLIFSKYILTGRVSYKNHYTNGVQYITMCVIDLKGTLVHRHNVGDM